MQAGTQEHEMGAATGSDGELATLYGGFSGFGEPYPPLVEAREDAGWDEESELDAQILAGLLRLAP
jgi:hypothetical protein